MSDPEPSGQDLARQALASWKAARKNAPATTGVTKPRKKRGARYSDARDPVGLGSVITQLGEEREWKTAVQGGSLTDRWPELCPELVGKVAPAAFDAASGRLELRPASPTYAAHLRILGPQLVTRLQAKDVPVRTIRVLAPGTLPDQSPTAVESRGAVPEAPIKTRADASPGYTDALEALADSKIERPSTEIQQRIKAAAAAQTDALRAKRENPEEHRDAVWFISDLEEAAAAEKEKVRQAAIRRARDQKADLAPAVPTVFQRTA